MDKAIKLYTRNTEITNECIFPDDMQRIALGVEYSGHLFHGFQAQKHDTQTVQQGLERALSHIANEPLQIVCAGRTDAGVHATQQIIHFDTRATRPESAWLRGANTQLPEGISIRWMQAVQPQFHARFSARSRTYRYVIYNTNTPSALLHRYVTWDRRRFDLAAMNTAAQTLIGEHDFSAFRAVQCQAKNPVRHLHHILVSRQHDFIVVEVKATAFLYHMVRNIMGVLMSIAAGEKPIAWAQQVLESRDRRCGGITAPADGLYLVAVDYDSCFNLPAMDLGPYFLG